jgi:hypothetical protein
VFEHPIEIRLATREAWRRRTAFEHGGDVFLYGAIVILDEASFAEPSLLTEMSSDALTSISMALFTYDDLPIDTLSIMLALAPPHVVSMRRAKVAQLTISGLDLSACRFVGAHSLDRLRIERGRFAQPPLAHRWFSRRRWTRRQTIAEEHHLRSEASKGTEGWYGEQIRAPRVLLDVAEPPSPGQVAGVYRALRKGLEDSGNEPGAADFYYGEMEMRRAAARTKREDGRHVISRGERLVLWLYWLIAGYGLRTSRALTALAVTILLAAIPLSRWGIEPNASYAHAVLFATESSISLLRAPQADLSPSGQAVEILLRVAGPLFFGLAVFSLRGRVKR